MSTEIKESTRGEQTKDETITVTVNEHRMMFHQRKATGLEIKKMAIAQSVPIQLDFVLFEVEGPGHLKRINDDHMITLRMGEAFRAVTPDDKS